MTIILRPYQLRAVDDVRDAYRAGHKAVCLQMPTGSGKTAVCGEVVRLALHRGSRVLWLAHRRELVQQACRRLEGIGFAPLPILSGLPPEGDRRICVGSIQSITARREFPAADLIIYDEAHHITARTSQQILAKYPDAHILGPTATPERGDGTALGDVFSTMVLGPTVKQLQQDGYLVEAEVYAPPAEDRALAQDPVAAWLAMAGYRQGFVFTRTVAESKKATVLLCDNGVVARHVDGNTPIQERVVSLAQFSRGYARALCSVNVFTEGTDLPSAEVCVLARKVAHHSTYLQMVGRVMRTSKGKKNATIIDLCGVAHRLGLPDDDRLWSLEGKAVQNTEPVTAIRQCPRCGSVDHPRVSCARCGYIFPPPPVMKVRTQKMRKVRSVDRSASLERRRAVYRALATKAAAQGYKPQWIGVMFKMRFGYWPGKKEKE